MKNVKTDRVLERFRLKRNRGTALSICLYALSYAKPLRTFAGNALEVATDLEEFLAAFLLERLAVNILHRA